MWLFDVEASDPENKHSYILDGEPPELCPFNFKLGAHAKLVEFLIKVGQVFVLKIIIFSEMLIKINPSIAANLIGIVVGLLTSDDWLENRA